MIAPSYIIIFNFLFPFSIEEVKEDGPNYSNEECKATGHPDLQVDFPDEDAVTFKCLPSFNCNFSTSKDGEMIEHYQSVHVHQKIDPQALCSSNCCPGPSGTSHMDEE